MDILEARINGWERRGIYDDSQLTRISEMYEELGFVVRLESFRPGIEAGCTECIKESPNRYKVIYTQKNDGE
ncbi:hypothetical protein [Desulfobacula sp.]